MVMTDPSPLQGSAIQKWSRGPTALRTDRSHCCPRLDTRDPELGGAVAVVLPSSTLAIAYLVFGIFLGVATIFAHPGVVSAVFEGSHLLVQLLFTPLVAGWSIWVAIAISARSIDVRAAQQLGFFASLPPLGIVVLMSFNVITPTLGLALGLAAGLLIIDVLGSQAVAAMFDRERLVTGTRG